MKIKMNRSHNPEGLVKRYGTVVRRTGAEQHRVTYVRSKSHRAWLCSCADFSFRRYAKNRHCDHLHAVTAKYGRYAAKVK
jgi:hypothetical protein